MERTTSSTLRRVTSLAALALGLVTSTASASAQQKAAIIVTGKAPDHDRSVVAAAVNDAVSRSSWVVDGNAFKPPEVDSIVKCLANDRPWPCIEPTVRARNLDRLVIVQVNLKAANAPSISAQLVFADDRVPPEESRFCERCTDASLIAATHDVMMALLRRANELPEGPPRSDGKKLEGARSTKFVVNTTPSGARIWIDGSEVGQAGAELSISIGRHVIDVELPGYRRETRTVNVTGNGNESLAVELQHSDQGPTKPSKTVPIVLISGGGAIVAGCIAYGLTLDPPPTGQHQDRVLVSWPAVGGVALGTIAVSAGLYLLLRGDGRAKSAPTVSLGSDGAVVGWARSFD